MAIERRTPARTSSRAPVRTAQAARPETGSRSSSKGGGGLFVHGDQAREQTERELAESKRRREEGGSRQPFRFWMPPGTERNYIILDEAPDVYLYEHTLMNPKTQRRDLYVPCVKAKASCPICQIQDSTFILLLTVLDMEGYEDSKGVWHEFSRKIMAVKPTQQKKFVRHFDREGTLRGAEFTAFRDKPTDAAIGSDHEFVDYVPEEELATFINEYESQGKIHQEDCSQPYDYEKIIREYSIDEMERIAGVNPIPGSRRDNDRHIDRSDTGGRSRSERPARSRTPEPEADGWEEQEDARPAARATGRRGAAAPASRAPAGRAAPRAASSARRAAPRSAPREAEPAPDDFDDDIPF